MQRTVKEGVLKHEKRKYQLNKKNELVKRIWNYYNEPNYQEKEKTEEIKTLIQKTRRLENIMVGDLGFEFGKSFYG